MLLVTSQDHISLVYSTQVDRNCSPQWLCAMNHKFDIGQVNTTCGEQSQQSINLYQHTINTDSARVPSTFRNALKHKALQVNRRNHNLAKWRRKSTVKGFVRVGSLRLTSGGTNVFCKSTTFTRGTCTVYSIRECLIVMHSKVQGHVRN
jgi:hypothetical protein